ncbi:N-acetylmuramoyl-L-alanine amidase family protein (plasmid) [Sinorhizobium meliloti]
MDRKELGASLNLRIELIPEGSANRSGQKIAPNFITIHNTSNSSPGANASAHSRFVREKGYYVLPSGKLNHVSWHYTVDDTCVIKHLPVNEKAIHAGPGNSASIGIEVCMHAGINQPAANQRAARLVAALMHDLRIKRENIVPHKHWTGKQCPTLLMGDFNNFRQNCEGICSAIEISAGASALVEDTELAEIRKAEEEGVADALSQPEPDPDPDEEHELIAAEVSKFSH